MSIDTKGMAFPKPTEVPSRQKFDSKAYHKKYSAEYYKKHKNDTPKVITCPKCGHDAEKYRSGLCRICYFEKMREKTRQKWKKVICAECGEEFQQNRADHKHCPKCRSIDRRWGKLRRKPQTATCPACEQTFQKQNPREVYCSQKCYDAARARRRYPLPFKRAERVSKGNCENCGKEIIRPTRRCRNKSKAPRFCSTQCHYAFARGEKNPSFREGRYRETGHGAWRKKANEIRARDKHQCVACGENVKEKNKRSPSVDHIIPYRLMIKWKMDADADCNLASLCNDCHGKKVGPESKLFHGDVIGFGLGLRKIGYPDGMIVAAFKNAGLSLTWMT